MPCVEDHDYGQCRLEQPKFCDRGGNHSVAYGGCEVMKREVDIQQLRTQMCTYAEAVNIENQRGGNSEGSRVGKQPIKRLVQSNEGKVMVNLKKLVTFVAGVVNATMEVKSKTERIQTIIKAAAHHLDLSGMT